MNAVCVDPARVHEIWPGVSGLIREAMRRGGLGSFAVVERAVLEGRNLLWLAWDGAAIKGAAVTSLEQTEWEKSCVIVACGGRELTRWRSLLSALECFAKAEGCSRIRIYGRRGWARVLPDYRTHSIVLEKEIN